MSKKIINLPEDDRVMRSVSWSRLRRDEDDNVLGFLPQAFQLRDGEEALSVNWIEFFENATTRIRDCIWAVRKTRNVGSKSAFAIGKVGKIKETCLSRSYKIRIVHEPKEGECSHSAIRRLPLDDFNLLSALAEDAFNERIMNSEIPPQ